VLGCDLSFAMLRVARAAAFQGRLRYARRRVGMVYDERSFAVPNPGAERIDFWCVDALSLPFADGTFGLATSMNLVDCVQSPLDHLKTVGRVVRPGGSLLLATPFDWSPGATALEAWIGGHSPRGTAGGSSRAILRALVTGDHPAGVSGLEVLDELDGFDWAVRLHERAIMRYLVDLYVLGRTKP
jgi:SAM-dependent methyltransferase